MIYHLSGELILLDGQYAVIECAGVGYYLHITNTAAGSLEGRIGEQVKVFTYLAVREDAVELFGFSTERELDCFKMLIAVNGVGAKYAIAILSVLSPDDLINAVSSEDARAISRAQGVGPKLAQRIILELKDKVGAIPKPAGNVPVSVAAGSVLQDAEEMLISLGYTSKEAYDAVRSINPEGKDLEEVFKAAIAVLAK